MKKLVCLLSLSVFCLLPVIVSAGGIDAFIPLFVAHPQGPTSIQSVYHISNICTDGAKNVTVTFVKNDGTKLAGHPVRLHVGSGDLYDYGTCTADCVSPYRSYTNADGTVSVSLPAQQQMYVVLLGNSTDYLNGWGKIDQTAGENPCLLANGFVRNGPENPAPYQRAVQISERPF